MAPCARTVIALSAFAGVDMWLSILRHHELANDAPRTEHSAPPTGSLHLPERVAAQEKVAVLRHVMSPSALQKFTRDTLAGAAGDTAPMAAAEEPNGPGELEDGVDWEDVADGVYLLTEHTQTKHEGHTFKFRLRKRRACTWICDPYVSVFCVVDNTHVGSIHRRDCKGEAR